MKAKTLLLITALFSVPFYLNAQNHSIDFDSADDYIYVTDGLNIESTSPFTIEAWIKSGNSTQIQQIISKLDVDFRGWGLQIENGFIAAYLITDYTLNDKFTSGSIIVSDNNWHHIAVSYDTITYDMKLYVDGSLDTASFTAISGTVSSVANSGDTYVGAYDANGNPGEFWSGQLDEIRVWNRALSGSEIADNYKTELDGSQSSLLLYYKFDTINPNCDIVDVSGNELHGTRGGTGGLNNLPQLSLDIPQLIDVANVNSSDCLNLNIYNAKPIENNHTYPNPAVNFVKISGIENEISYRIYNSCGIETAVGLVSVDGKIEVQNFTNGLYFLHLGNGSIIKFIKE